MNIQCKFQNNNYWPQVETFYGCEVTNTINITEPNTFITSVSGSHTSGKNHSMVEEIIFKDSKSRIHYFPKGIDKIFPHLKSIRIWYVELMEIHQDDLKPFAELEMFHPTSNKLEFLEKDLFKYNTKLKSFAADGNPIAYMDPNVFDNLEALTSLFIASCNVSHAVSNRTAVVRVIQQVKDHCSKPSLLAKYEHRFYKDVETRCEENSKAVDDLKSEQLGTMKHLAILERRSKSLIERLANLEDSLRNETKQNRDHRKLAEELSLKLQVQRSDLSHQNNSSQLIDALTTRNVLIFIITPLMGFVTLLNVFLIIACFRRRSDLIIQSSDNGE